MTQHDYFIFTLETKQRRIREAIKEYRKIWLSDTTDSAPVKAKEHRGNDLKAKLLAQK